MGLAYETAVRAAASANLAMASAHALGYIDVPQFVLHLFLWPSIVFAMAFAAGAIWLAIAQDLQKSKT